MNTEEVKTNKLLEVLRTISNAYFSFFDHLLNGIEFLFWKLLHYIVLGAKYIGKFFVKTNKNNVVHYIYVPFIILFKITIFIPKVLVHYIKGLSMQKKRGLTGYGFLIPWIIGFLGFVAYPIIILFFYSFNDVRQVGQDYNYKFVGLDNYRRILRVDIDFMTDVQDFVVRVLLYTPVVIALAVIVAMLLNQSVKGKGFFRMVFFLPVIILNGQLLTTMSENGGMDIHLSRFVLDLITTIVPVFALDLFIDLFSIIIEILWYTGVPILIFLAMLQKIDRSLYEAASIDGANAWSMFWKITLPIIRPAISVAVIFIVVFLANFDGNPINGLIVSSNGDPQRYQGYAAAMAFIYSFVQIFVIGILLLITTPKRQKRRA